MRLTDFAFDLPGENRSSLALAGITESMITGFFDYLSNDVEKLADMTARIVTSAANVKEISTGIQRFKSNVKDMGSVDVSAWKIVLPETHINFALVLINKVKNARNYFFSNSSRSLTFSALFISRRSR